MSLAILRLLETKMTTSEHPLSSSLYSAFIKNAKHPKSIRAAENVRNACEYLADHGIEISIAEVARLCESTGPNAQSIHNNQALKAYVSTRRSEQPTRSHPTEKGIGYVSQDPHANAVIHALQAQLKIERETKESLKRAIQNAGEYDVEAVLRTGRLVSFTRSTPILDSEVIEVVRTLLDTDHLRRFGLFITADRMIAPDRNDRVFLEKRLVLKLRSLLEPSRILD